MILLNQLKRIRTKYTVLNRIALYGFSRWTIPILLLLFFISLSFPLLAQTTSVIFLSGKGAENTVDWDFFCTAGTQSGYWTKIPVPSCWELQGFGSYDYGRNNPMKDRLKEEGLYRHEFVAETSWKNKQVSLVFDGVMTDCEVKLNGKKVGETHHGAFYQFKYPVDQLLKYGKTNLLEVYVKKHSDNASINEAERNADFWVFGGIFRPVYLEVNPEKHIQQFAVDARADGKFVADVYLSAPISGGKIDVEIADKEGKVVAGFEKTIVGEDQKVSVEGVCVNPQLWTPEFPNLYKVTFSLLNNKGKLLHQTSEKIGFRTVEVREQDGIYVNDVRIKFKGVNRHTFHPDYGRASSKAFSIDDVNLIKDMNMNAVRMSHYPPEKHFLDACDSLGLFVLDELTGWQSPSYDSEIGRKLVKEMIVHDVNHPSIVLWDNGNEGGWNTSYDSYFKELDIQKREVLHPWSVFEKTNTAHYIDYNYFSMDNFAQRKILFPTEFLHGLYDGGHGAGLEDYWTLIYNNPLCAGGFLWSFADECVFRSDIKGLDCKGNLAPDGILGPYHEKEGSFYTIREVWSPIHIEKRYITPEFNGTFNIQNRYHYTNLDQCKLTYEWIKISSSDYVSQTNSLFKGDIKTGSIQPGQNAKISVDLINNWENADILKIVAHDLYGRLIHSWTYPVKSARQFYTDANIHSTNKGHINVQETNDKITLEQGDISLEISKMDGTLLKVSNKNKLIPLSGGPVLGANSPKLASIEHSGNDSGHVVVVRYEKNNMEVRWEMLNNGLVNLDVKYQLRGDKLTSAGISFSYPESDIKEVSYIGNGPYRVWKNRMAGPTFGVWNKNYDNDIDGYPKFKGYYSNLYWANFESKTAAGFSVYSKTDDLFLRLFTPDDGDDPSNTAVKHPSGDISFLNGIPAIGTKFKRADHLGPQSQPYKFSSLHVENGRLQISLTFDFNQK